MLFVWLIFRVVPLGQIAGVVLVVAALQFLGIDVLGMGYDWLVSFLEGIALDALAP
ncbi:hypothetical protein SAMN04487949_1768 [Halogranum gelatinilyticum]|uniref:Uncharacterized protein n=1 Tax=Halogranum gelatinilyticum TaxID=660521 RepID=A0A1G9TGR2_9EURY|nr:hypothetical protein [Halogranum gelatinilyticum]SDM46931.1 hypothetical protein SAMN04487949_1768 [Halogranum gelatinilyticum]